MIDEELRCTCANEDGTVRCRNEMTRDDGLCDFCRVAKEQAS